jgi:hypothetical protein
MSITKENAMKYHLALEHDQDVESPCDFDGSWKFYSFNRKNNNYRDPYDFITRKFRNGEWETKGAGANIGFQRKLDVGTAFIISCYEHSGIIYSIRGEGMQCQWDTTRIAGVLVWEESPKNMGAKTYTERENDARNFLKEYNHWVNGECYYYCLEDEKGEHIDSCGGYIGYESIWEVLREEHSELFVPGVELEVTGDAKWILE